MKKKKNECRSYPGHPEVTGRNGHEEAEQKKSMVTLMGKGSDGECNGNRCLEKRCAYSRSGPQLVPRAALPMREGFRFFFHISRCTKLMMRC